MIGDKMLIYNRDTGQFFAKWRGRNREPVWCDYAAEAHVFYRIGDAYSTKESLGLGVRIVSEKESIKIDTLKRREGVKA